MLIKVIQRHDKLVFLERSSELCAIQTTNILFICYILETEKAEEAEAADAADAADAESQAEEAENYN